MPALARFSLQVTVQVWNWNVFKDSFMGQVTVPLREYLTAARVGSTFAVTLNLTDRGGASHAALTGALVLEIQAARTLEL